MSVREAIILDSDHIFIPTGEPIESGIIPNIDYLDDRDLANMVRENWARDSEAHQAEIGLLRMCDSLYNGFHYRDPQLNRDLAITNFAFATVETVWPSMVENMPFPQALPRYNNSSGQDDADEVSHVAQWLQDKANVRRTYRRNLRTKLKFGHAIHLCTSDPVTGMPAVVDWSPYDCVFDASCTRAENMDRITLAAPVPTRKLKAQYPLLGIQRDNFASPSYESTRLPYFTHYAPLATTRRTPDIYGSHAYKEGDVMPAGGAVFTLSPPGGVRHTGSPTTFLLQTFIRDYTLMPAVVPGYIMRRPGPGNPNPTIIPNQYYQIETPTCPTGWRFMSCTSDGKVVENGPVDRCYDGLPIVIDYDYEHEGRIHGIGEIEQIASLNRQYNERDNLINRALRLAANPVLIASKGSGINFDKRGIEAGDVLQPTRGTEIKWLESAGPSQFQFEHAQTIRGALDTVSGVHDSSRGARPAGIEAGTAIAQLSQADLRRVRGKEPAHLDAWSSVMTKLIMTAAYKLRPGYYMGADGEPRMVNCEKLKLGWDIMFAQGTLLNETKDQRDSKMLALADRNLVPGDMLIRQLNPPNAPALIQSYEAAQAQKQSGPDPDAAAKVTALAALEKSGPGNVSFDEVQQAVAMLGIRPGPMDPVQKELVTARVAKAHQDAKPKPAPVIGPGGGGDKGGGPPQKGTRT